MRRWRKPSRPSNKALERLEKQLLLPSCANLMREVLIRGGGRWLNAHLKLEIEKLRRELCNFVAAARNARCGF